MASILIVGRAIRFVYQLNYSTTFLLALFHAEDAQCKDGRHFDSL